jgi:hypothetical protein
MSGCSSCWDRVVELYFHFEVEFHAWGWFPGSSHGSDDVDPPFSQHLKNGMRTELPHVIASTGCCSP